MNPSEHRLNRILDAALNATPPIPPPSFQLQQRMIAILREKQESIWNCLDGFLTLRIFAAATVVMAICVALPLMQVKNPYHETINLANSLAQLEKP